MIAIALAVRTESEGPALFRQPREGLGRRTFTLFKFRTMFQGGDDRRLRDLIARELRGEDTTVNGSSKLNDDNRVTRVGSFLRRTSLDELPQLINVLRRRHDAGRAAAVPRLGGGDVPGRVLLAVLASRRA